MPRARKGSPPVLVVDDYPDSRDILRRMLEIRGIRVAEAADGPEAVEVARREPHGLILMDLTLPTWDGIAAVQKIRDLGMGYQDVPVVAVTAYDTPEMRKKVSEAGFVDYLVKPVGFDTLDSILRRFMPA